MQSGLHRRRVSSHLDCGRRRGQRLTSGSRAVAPGDLGARLGVWGALSPMEETQWSSRGRGGRPRGKAAQVQEEAREPSCSSPGLGPGNEEAPKVTLLEPPADRDPLRDPR